VRIPIAELEAAGLYDPASPGAADRLALLEWLADIGATESQMVGALRDGTLGAVVAEIAQGGGPRLTVSEASARTGVPADRIEAFRFAAGLPAVGADEAVTTEEEARSVAVLTMAEELFGRDAVRRFTQVLGTSLARMAEAAVTVSIVNLEGPIQQTGGGELALARARFRAAQTIPSLAQAVRHLFLAHISVAARRLRRSLPQGSVDTARLAVGFVDLVGFTTLARQMEPRALATVVEGFEETAHDVAALHEGRVVKFVGDEVMFVTQSASAACDIALGLVERFVADASVTPRGAVAAGEMLVRGGDYYGPVVNLAARMAEAAVPREVLVTDAVTAEAVGERFRFEPAGRRILKGFEEPVRLFAVERSAG
jgi:class 3 adenylate cyclase